MNSISREQLWKNFSTAGVVTGKMPQEMENDTPWYVRVMLGFAGWLGAIFLLLFVGFVLSSILKNPGSSLIVGVITCVFATILLNNSKADFASQFGLAVSLAGQALFVVGLVGVFTHDNRPLAMLGIAVLEAVLVYLVNNAIHRVISAAAAAIALSFALADLGMLNLVMPLIMAGAAFLWINEPKWSFKENAVAHAGYGIVLASLYSNSALMMRDLLLDGRHRYVWATGPAMYWIGVAVLCGVFLAVIFAILKREQARFETPAIRFALAAAVLISVLSFKAPGILTGLIIVLLGYANGNRVLWGFGIFALLVYLSQYYYMLQETLLVKSGILFATGAGMLGILVLMRLFCRTSESTEG